MIKKVSIIIVTYNSLNNIKSCLSSVYKQNLEYFEIIVIDNCSKDETANYIKENYPEIRLITNTSNLGASKARNQGIEISRGEWILVLDCDVVIEEGFLRGISYLLESVEDNVGIIQPKILNIDGSSIYSCGLSLTYFRRFYDIGKGKPEYSFKDKSFIFGACSAAALYRRAMLDDIKDKHGYFDNRFFFLVEDVDLAWRANNKSWRAIFEPSLVVFHQGNSSATNKKERQFFCFRNRFLMIAKNQGLFQYILRFLPIFFYDVPRFLYMLITGKFFFRKLHDAGRV